MLRPLDLTKVRQQQQAGWAASPRGDPTLVPISKLVRFLDLAQDSESDAQEAVDLAREILDLEPSNKLVLDHLPTVEARLNLQEEEEDDDEKT